VLTTTPHQDTLTICGAYVYSLPSERLINVYIQRQEHTGRWALTTELINATN